jgi:nitrogen fixation/metabolism regulation signal transduction histidine kinase
MKSLHQVRGTGVRYTMRYVLRFSGLWLFVCVLTLVVFAVTSYMGLFDRLDEAGRNRLMMVLVIQTIAVALGMVCLAVFTTHRIAGPLVGLRRAFDDVKAGDLHRRLRFREADRHLEDVETSFNEMVDTLRARIVEGRSSGRAAGGESA